MKHAMRWALSLRRGRWVTAIATTLVLTFTMAAGAATQQRSQTIDLKDTKRANVINTGLQTTHIHIGCPFPDCDDLDEDIGGSFTGGLEVEWVNPVRYEMSYTDSLVRQGETLDMRDVVGTQGGTVKVSVFVHGEFGVYDNCPDNCVLNTGLPHIDEDKTIELGTFDCTIPLPGENPRRCDIGEEEETLFHITLFEVFSIDLKGRVNLYFDSTGTPISSLRIATSASDESGGLQTPLSFEPTSPVTLDDRFKVPCTEPAGMDFFYKLTDNSYTASSKFTTKLTLFVVGSVGPVETPDLELWSDEFDLLSVPDLEMKGPDIVENLGPIQPKTRLPVIGNIDAPDGDEGSQIQFHVVATDTCGPPSVRWDFSDGGVAFGPDPKHTFHDEGHYTGLVTASDPFGNKSTKTFALDIANVAPIVNAGPDTTAKWGRAVQFNGQATDPGSDGQPTLQYEWSFGDGTPSATGGPSVVHSYSVPGDYTATFRVCDKADACVDDSRVVYVKKRDTSVGYLGDTSGTYDSPANLSASLVDEFGQSVNGRSISFSVATDGPLSALTNSSGIASKSYTPTLAAGSYTGSSSFAGDSLYNGSNSSNGFAVAKKATTTVYTGAITGGANKTIVLSAVLKDATGKPLAGRTIVFQLGSQSASAVTNSNGVAATSLKLNQKNGTYTVSATYDPAGADAPLYLGSSQGTIFKLQAK